MWVGGANKWLFSIGFFVVIGIIIGFVVLCKTSPETVKELFPKEYMFKRVDMWLNPEAYDVQSDTWQTVQGKIAVGSGGLFGRGLGKSLQKHLFVSQPQNDFIYSIVCEEFGFIGGVGVIVLYFVFIFRGLHIAKNSRDVFSALTVIGIVGHVGTQALLNIGVVTGLLPNTGITLPFFSAGGSSLIILLAEMGIILTISRRARIDR
jgi:cell division protein FtsW